MSGLKKCAFLILFFVCIVAVNSQEIIKGKVLDAENDGQLEDVFVTNTTKGVVVHTNEFGEFELTQLGVYKFVRIGYFEKEIEIKNKDYKIIKLQPKPSELNEIVIHANQLSLKLKKSVATVHVLSERELKRGSSLNMDAVLNRVPGVFMQSGSLNTNRITIRGIGARNLFGTAKIRAYFDEIPLTTGSGETTIEEFELNSVARFEIVKGANSSIYGAGLGGVIHLLPKKTNLNESSFASQLTIGSFGLLKGTMYANHGTSKNGLNAIYSNTHSDGYRDNNKYDRQTFTISSSHYFDKKNSMSVVGSYVALKAFIPSSITKTTFDEKPKSAAFTWGKAKGFEDSKRAILGISWKHQFMEHLKQTTSVFSSFRDAYEPRPFNVLAEKTFAIGVRSRMIGKSVLFSKKLNWTFGGEVFKDKHRSETFENLYENFSDNRGSVQGDRLSNLKEDRLYFNLFLEGYYHLSLRTLLSVGLNMNRTSYDLVDDFVQGTENQSGNYSFKNVWSPKIGFSHLLMKSMSLYGNIGHGFSPPSLSETLLPDGKINTEIQPETGWNYEIGLRGVMLRNKLQFNAAIFRMNIENLLVARRSSEDEFIGVNAGKTKHEGIEFNIDYEWANSGNNSLNTYVSYTLNNFIFEEFIDEEQNFSGNDLTGVPSKVINGGVDFSTVFGMYGTINYQYVGRMPITDSNSLYSDAYAVTNLKLGYKLELNKHLNLNTFIGVNNLFNEKYASQILINASSFGGKAPRYYYPGTPINYYSGIRLNYLF